MITPEQFANCPYEFIYFNAVRGGVTFLLPVGEGGILRVVGDADLLRVVWDADPYGQNKSFCYTTRLVCYNPGMEHKNRQRTRLRNFDYSQNGAYFITVCVKDREKLLSVIFPSVGDGVLDVPFSPNDPCSSFHPRDAVDLVLTPCGQIVDEQIRSINAIYPNISVIQYVIMPDHIHMIITVDANAGASFSGSSGTPTHVQNVPVLLNFYFFVSGNS